MNIEKTKQIKYLIKRCESLKQVMIHTLDDNTTAESGRYANYKTYAEEYSILAKKTLLVIDCPDEQIKVYHIEKMKSWADTLWPYQKNIIESVLVYTEILIALLEKEIDFADSEYDNIVNFIDNRLRSCIYKMPDKEVEIQNALESLFIGRDWNKGIDYDRETGKIVFSGREYVPDFVIPKLELCIEVKLLRVGKKSSIIEDINADITAYSKQYKRILFVVYDLGDIRDEIEFRRDIENAKENIKVLVIKH